MEQEPKVRLLVVDDDPAVVRLVGRFAGDLSFETLEAIHPAEALRLASQQHIDVAVVDFHMPEMQGVDLMRSLQDLNRNMEVILMTGDYSLQSATESIESGAYDYLPKPLDFRHLGQDLHAIRRRVLRRLRA